MVIDLPWQMILASLDESQTRDATFAALSKTLAESAGDRDASFASMMAPHIKSLKSVAAKELAFQLFRDYSDVPEVLEAALADVAHDSPGFVRQPRGSSLNGWRTVVRSLRWSPSSVIQTRASAIA